MNRDRYDLPLTTASDRAAAHYRDGVDRVLSAWYGADEAFDRAIADDPDFALAHIARYGSHHTDAIITEDKAAAARFTREVDSAIVTVNASTQFADGGEFGFGAEIGVSTGRLHARGPVGAAQLVTYKYIVTTARPGGAVRA